MLCLFCTSLELKFLINFYEFLSAPTYAACSAHLMHLDLIVLIMLHIQFNFGSYMLCNFHYSIVILSALEPHVLVISSLFSDTIHFIPVG